VIRCVTASRVRSSSASRWAICASRTSVDVATYLALASPVARRLYRLIRFAAADGAQTWAVAAQQLVEQLPLTQRYPSHVQRVLQPAHDALEAAGVIHGAVVHQHLGVWHVDYLIGPNKALSG